MNALESAVLPFTEYLLDIKLPIKQTDHYAIRLFLRIVLFLNDRVRFAPRADPQILPYCNSILYRLVNLLSYMSNVIPNPYFIHYLFESLVAFVRISRSQPDLCASIEQYLTPYLRDVPFSPLLFSSTSTPASSSSSPTSSSSSLWFPVSPLADAQIIYSRSTPSESSAWLLSIVLSEDSWKERSYQTALVFLLSVFLLRFPAMFGANETKTLFLLFQKLCSARSSRLDGIKLLAQIVSSLPKDAIESYLPRVVNILAVLVEVGFAQPTQP